jgi:hypothetical protein
MRYGQDDARQTSPCWESDLKVQALRVEFADGHCCLVPYSRIAFVDIESGASQSALCLRSDTHEIRIVGKNLGRLESALQRFEVGWVKPAPARYELDASDNWVWITNITVSELQGRT